MFQGTFEEAKAKAVEEGKWLVRSSSSQHWTLQDFCSQEICRMRPLLMFPAMCICQYTRLSASASICVCQHLYLHLPTLTFASTLLCQHSHLPVSAWTAAMLQSSWEKYCVVQGSNRPPKNTVLQGKTFPLHAYSSSGAGQQFCCCWYGWRCHHHHKCNKHFLLCCAWQYKHRHKGLANPLTAMQVRLCSPGQLRQQL